MRKLALLLTVIVCLPIHAQVSSTPQRYGVEIDLRTYPQTTPQATIQSVVTAIDEGDQDYLLAHLADPMYVDSKVNEYKKLYKGPEDAKTLVAFNQIVKEFQRHLRTDPTIVQELRRYVNESKKVDWKIDEVKGEATAQLPDTAIRQAYFKNIEGRWYLLNKRQ